MTRKLLSNVYVIKLRITQIILIILIYFPQKPQITRITLIFRLCIFHDLFLTNDFTDYSPQINANKTKIIIGYLRYKTTN